MSNFPDSSPLLRDPRFSPFDSVADEEVDRLFAPLADAAGLVLAVSGGPDSLALLLLAARWRAVRPGVPPIIVASVDHGLRPSAAGEALAVVALAGRLGFAARKLDWRGEKPRRGVQEAARTARYRLLADAAREAGASHVVVAHHRDDQAETVLMRLGAGSGVGGLAAMRPLVTLAGADVMLARPLLALSKVRLIAVAAEAGVVAVDDPANRDPKFARARLRHLEAERAALGLTPGRLARLAERCARAEDALAAIAAARFAELVRRDGHVSTLSAEVWREPDEIVMRIFELTVAMEVPDIGRRIALERLERLVRDLRVASGCGTTLHRTLHGATVRMSAAGDIAVAREPPRRRGAGGPKRAGNA